MVVAMIALTSFAQQQGGRERREFKPEDAAARRADRVKETAKISDEQYKKVYDLFLKRAQESQAKMQEARKQEQERRQFNREEMKKEREATTAALKEILSPEQFEAYEKAQKERMQRGGRGSQGGRPGGKRPNGKRPNGKRPANGE